MVMIKLITPLQKFESHAVKLLKLFIFLMWLIMYKIHAEMKTIREKSFQMSGNSICRINQRQAPPGNTQKLCNEFCKPNSKSLIN